MLSGGNYGESVPVWLPFSCSFDAGSAAVQRYSDFATSVACVLRSI